MIPDGLTIGGYFPGSIGQVVQAHALYYHKHWGFDVSFESQVARELGEFMGRYDPGRDGFWTARIDGSFLGSIAIDGNPENPDGARLRWFIVASGFRGKGLGSILYFTCCNILSGKWSEKDFSLDIQRSGGRTRSI